MGAYLTIALRNLKQAKKRTMLLSLALALVTLLLVLTMSLSKSINDTMMHTTTALMTGHVNIAGFYKNKPGDALPMIADVQKIQQIAEKNIPGLDSVVIRDQAFAQAIGSQNKAFTILTGIDIHKETRLPEVIKLAKESAYKEGGRNQVFGDLKQLSKRHTALVFAKQAKRLGVDIGDYLTLTAKTGNGRTNTLDVTVVAVAKDFSFLSNYFIFVPLADIHELYQTKPTTSAAVWVYLKDPDQAALAIGPLRDALKKGGYQVLDYQSKPFYEKFAKVAAEDWTGQKLDLATWKDELSNFYKMIEAINSISFVVVAVLLLIIAVGIMNSMWISVRERTREVGTMRAIGMTRRRVLLMFLSEALLLGLVGTSTGALLGIGLTVAIDAAAFEIPNEMVQLFLMSDTLRLSVPLTQIVKVVLAFTAFTGFFALWPALKAARLQPVTAIHHAD